jgi:hypothetical protein
MNTAANGDNALMKAVRTKIIAAIVATLIVVWSVQLLAANLQSQPKKTWEFRAQRGIVKIELFVNSYPGHPDIPSLDLIYSDDSQPSLGEEVGFIREVLHQLPGLGVDPHSLSVISMPGFAEPEVRQRVALAALHSKEWRSRVTALGGAERVVADFLNSLGAYDSFNSALEEYGLRIKAIGAEKVASTKCLDLKISDPLCNVRHNVQVPTGASLNLAIEKKGEIHEKPPGRGAAIE